MRGSGLYTVLGRALWTPARPSLCAPLRCAGPRVMRPYDPRWGGRYTTPWCVARLRVLAAPASITGSELSSLLGSGLYTVLGCAFLLSSILIRAALALRPSALRRSVGGANMTTPGGTRTPYQVQLQPPCSAHRLLSQGRSFQSTWLRPFALPRPDALSPLPAVPVSCALLCPLTPAHNTHQRMRSLTGGPGPIGAGRCAVTSLGLNFVELFY